MNQQKIAELIREECAAIATMLTEKNRKYGNAVIEPVSVFSRSGALERINVRIDDKLQRMANRQDDEDEDVEKDLIGYLLYRRVMRRLIADSNPPCPGCGVADGQYHKVDCSELPDASESRMDVIGQNGNDGLHYAEVAKRS